MMVVIKKQLINKSTNKQVSLQKQEADSFARSPNMRSDVTHCVKTHHGMGTGVLKLPKKKLSSWSRAARRVGSEQVVLEVIRPK